MWLLEDELHLILHIYQKKSFQKILRYEVLTAQRRYILPSNNNICLIKLLDKKKVKLEWV